jgi:exopolysaccharide biosynthesis protein
MKSLRTVFYVILLTVVLIACAPGRVPSNQVLSNRLLADTAGWVVDTLSADMIHYRYTSWYEPQKAFQVVNVLEFDPASKDKKVIVAFDEPLDSLSSACQEYPGIVAGINGTYFDKPGGKSYNFVKADGKVLSQIEVADTSLYFWKSQGRLSFSGDGKAFDIEYTDVKRLQNSRAANILTGAPVLIYKYQPVGMQFVKSPDSVLSKLHYEHPDRHQGLRHPRTAIAITNTNHLLLITVDGRHKQAAGMSARELTEFITRYFRPRSALNLDGGGSTTMWISGANVNGVVNYPSDNKKFDHYGQRPAESFILIQKINSDQHW